MSAFASVIVCAAAGSAAGLVAGVQARFGFAVLQSDLPPQAEPAARGDPGGYFRGETRPRLGCVRRRLTGIFRDKIGAGNGGKTAQNSAAETGVCSFFLEFI